MKKVLLHALCCALTTAGLWVFSAERTYGQVAGYGFTATSGTYTPITGGTSFTSAITTNIDDNVFATVTLPFTFNYANANVTTVSISANGYMRLGAATGTYYSVVLSGQNNTIAGLADDLYSLSTTTGRDISYAVTGTSPNRVFTVQWTSWGFYEIDPTTFAQVGGLDDVNFQIKLYETSNNVQIVYGAFPMTTVNAQAPQVGLSGATTADFKVLDNSTTSWANPAIAANNTTSMVLSQTVKPTSGLTYTFTPPSCLGPSSVTATPTGTTTGTINFSAPTSAPSGGYQYEVRTSGAAGSGATGLVASGNIATGTTQNVTGLTPATTYTVYVRSNCGSGNFSAWSTAVTFTTQCNAFSAPFVESFNTATTPNCWTNTGVPELWYFNQSGLTGSPNPDYAADNITDHTGNSGYFAWVDGSGTGTNTGITLTSPVINITTVANPRLRFFVFSQNATPPGNNLLKIEALVGTSWVLLDSVKQNLGTTWFEKTVSLSSITTTTTQIRFVVDELGGNPASFSAFNNDILIDDVNIEATPSCNNPTSVVASAITATTATISWTAASPAPANGYQYEVRTSGGAGSGATGLVTSGSTVAGVVTANVTGLTGVTTYQVYVRAVCSGTSFSTWSQGSFTTSLDCSAATNITSCGVLQSFAIPAGTGAYNPIITAVGTAPFGTAGIEKLYTFTATTTGVYTLDVTVTNSQWADYYVKPATGGCANSGWTYWDDMFSPAQDTMTLIGGTQYFVLVDPESSTSAPAQTFRILCPPTCGQPNTVAATAITTTSASIGWTQPAVGTPAQYQISYGAGITTPTAGTSMFVTTNPASLTGLTPATSYTVYVRAICGAGDSSQWSAAYTFQTQCVAFTLPFIEDFNSAGFPPTCWSRATDFLPNTPTALTPTTGNSWTSDGYLNNGTTGATKINLYSNFHRDWLISPSIDLGTTPGNFVMEFNMAVPVWNSTSAYDTLGTDDTVAVVISYNNGATWTSANALKIWTAADDTIGNQRYYLPFSGSGQIKFGLYGGDGTLDEAPDMDIFFDSIRVVQCFAPVVNLGADTTLCGSGLSITLNGGPGTGYIWSTGDSTQTITVTNAGTYSVTVISGSLGCTDTDSITVATGTLPVVNLGPDVTVCGNVASLLLDAGNPGANYVWSSPVSPLPFTTQVINLGPIVNALNQNSAGLGVSTAPVYATVTNAAGCMGMDSVNVSVIFTARVGNIITGGTDPNMTFAPVADSFATTYNWTFGDGSAPVTTQNATHTYNTNGTFTVTLVVSNSCSSDTVTTTVTIASASVSDVALGQGTLTLYPNPTAADATLEVSNGLKLRGVQMMSATGQVVMDRRLDGNTRTTLNTSVLAPGIYTLRVQLDKGVVVRKLEVLK